MESVIQKIVTKIIQEQELIMGPLAWEEAQKVSGLQVDIVKHIVNLQGNPKEVLERLVSQYQQLFGRASVEVCRDAARPLLSQASAEEVPAVLK